MVEEKKPLPEHARIMLRRMVCSYAYEEDPIMEFQKLLMRLITSPFAVNIEPNAFVLLLLSF